MTGEAGSEIIAGVGDEVFYFFVLVFLLMVVMVAWYSTAVLEPLVQSVILVERAVPGDQSQEAVTTSPEEVREAVTQFLQHQAGTETVDHVVQQGEEAVVELPSEERVTIRLKFLNDTQRDVEASLVENIGQFKRRNFTEELSSDKNVRLIFNGQVLRDEASSLRSCGLFDKCVVHCLVHTTTSGQAGHTSQQSVGDQPERQQQDLDLSALFVPVLGLALAMLWYFALAYSAYFNLMSTTALLGLTSLYLLSVYGTHFHLNVAVRTARRGPDQRGN